MRCNAKQNVVSIVLIGCSILFFILMAGDSKLLLLAVVPLLLFLGVFLGVEFHYRDGVLIRYRFGRIRDEFVSSNLSFYKILGCPVEELRDKEGKCVYLSLLPHKLREKMLLEIKSSNYIELKEWDLDLVRYNTSSLLKSWGLLVGALIGGVIVYNNVIGYKRQIPDPADLIAVTGKITCVELKKTLQLELDTDNFHYILTPRAGDINTYSSFLKVNKKVELKIENKGVVELEQKNNVYKHIWAFKVEGREVDFSTIRQEWSKSKGRDCSIILGFLFIVFSIYYIVKISKSLIAKNCTENL